MTMWRAEKMGKMEYMEKIKNRFCFADLELQVSYGPFIANNVAVA